MTEETYKPTLELGTSLLSLEMALSCHFDISLAINGYIWFCFEGFYKFVGKEGEGHSGLWSQNFENE